MSNWTPHAFARRAEEATVAPDAIGALLAEGERLRQKGIPVVFTLGHLAAICDVPYNYLRKIIARRSPDSYRVFSIRKRSGGHRLITVPEPQLMRVQRWIHLNILATSPINPISTAYARGCGPVRNALHHCGSRW